MMNIHELLFRWRRKWKRETLSWSLLTVSHMSHIPVLNALFLHITDAVCYYQLKQTSLHF